MTKSLTIEPIAVIRGNRFVPGVKLTNEKKLSITYLLREETYSESEIAQQIALDKFESSITELTKTFGSDWTILTPA